MVAHPPRGGHSDRRADYLGWLALVAIAGVLATWLPAIQHRYFDSDEFEHAHAAWCVFRGMLPYRDFFEHHTPWYYYLLAPFFGWFDVASSFAGARSFLLFGRGLSLLLTLASVVLVVRLGSLWQARRVGLLAGLLLVLQPIFFTKSFEIRPDVLALPCFLGSLCLLLPGMAPGTAATARRMRYFIGGGLSLGAAIMCTQKMLFVVPGLFVGLVPWSLAGGLARQAPAPAAAEARLGVRPRIGLAVLFFAGICVPAGLTWAAFALQHAGGVFITNNFLLNVRWKPIETHQFAVLLSTSWPVLALGALGGAVPLVTAIRGRGLRHDSLLLLCTLVGLFAGALAIPSAWAQYYLMPLPICCLFAAHVLVVAVARAGRAQHVLLALVLVGLAVLPARKLRHSIERRNDRQLARLRQVIENTRPDDLVMDGWEGVGVFRPHAFHYFFLHRETLAMLPPADLASFLAGLERGAIRPALIALDVHLMALGPRFQNLVRTKYTSTDGFFYFPRPFWRSYPGGLL